MSPAAIDHAEIERNPHLIREIRIFSTICAINEIIGDTESLHNPNKDMRREKPSSGRGGDLNIKCSILVDLARIFY